MYTIKKVADLAGVTLKTLRHYDKIGLLSPSARGENKYRWYSEEDLEKLQQIMFFKELDYSLDEIGKIINSSEFDRSESLKKQIELLKRKEAKISKIIALAENTLKNLKGEITMTENEKFEAFKEEMLDKNEKQYGSEVTKKYGENSYHATKQKLKKMTKEEYDDLSKLSEDVNDAFTAALKTKNPHSPEARCAVELHKKWLSYYWAEFNKDAYIELAKGYADDERFAAYYNKLGDGMAVFVRDAILSYFK